MNRPTSITVFASVALALAGCSEGPVSPVAPAGALTPQAPAAVAAEADTPDGAPRFVPYDTQPRLTNNAEITALMAELYPDELREAGVGGMASVWLFIGEDGVVRDARLHRSSGADGIDAAAVELAREMTFTPALHHERPVAVWVQIPISFTTGR